jgi:hypothetical protein
MGVRVAQLMWREAAPTPAITPSAAGRHVRPLTMTGLAWGR